MRTGIPPLVWLEEDERTLHTALILLSGEDSADGGDDGPVTSG